MQRFLNDPFLPENVVKNQGSGGMVGGDAVPSVSWVLRGSCL